MGKIEVQGYKYYIIEKNVVRISKDKNVINDNWTKLKMDGLLAFHIISNNDGARHIRVAMYTNGNYQKPVLVFISNYLSELDYSVGNMVLGRTFSKYSGLDEYLSNFTKVDKIDYSEYIAVYKEDSFKNICDQLINKDKFEEVLKETNLAFMEMGNTIHVRENLYDFMGAFDYDYDNELNIEQVEFEFEIKNEILMNQEDLEVFLGHKLIQLIVVKFNRIISLDEITKDYALFRDGTGTLYLITFIRGDILSDDDVDLIEWNNSFK